MNTNFFKTGSQNCQSSVIVLGGTGRNFNLKSRCFTFHVSRHIFHLTSARRMLIFRTSETELQSAAIERAAVVRRGSRVVILSNLIKPAAIRQRGFSLP